MSGKRRSTQNAMRERAAIFAALGDETRLAVLVKLGDRQPHSISRLTAGTRMSRQAVTKHLRVLARAGIVRNVHLGRENLFKLETPPIESARDYLTDVSRQWDDTLARLKAHLEK
ncbi:MAG: helix-turn-helix transcriptional regulator [Methylobacteriaceae bacterium]|nr:helix-turn-helix transcriptional regulator [Methylobacteriaceae bacterium]